MSLLLLLGLALAGGPALPEVKIAYTRDLARVTLLPPPGEHIEPTAPVSGWLEPRDGMRWQVATDGHGLEEGLLVGVSGEDRQLAASLRVSLCQDGGSSCRPVDLGFDVALPGRKGELRVSPYVPKAEELAPQAPRYGVSADAAFATAAKEGRRVLIDFGAVWCPPCNLLAAQVLEDPANEADLAGFVVVGIDSDAPESWALKDRYHVRGYPTLVVTDASGQELDRLEGYETEASFLAWLGRVGSAAPLSARPEPESLDSRAALALVVRLLEAGEDEAAVKPYLDRLDPARAPELQEEVDLHLARYTLTPSAAEARWLAAKGAPVASWGWTALDLTKEDAELRGLVRAAAEEGLAHASATEAADLLQILGELAGQEGGAGGRAHFLAAALLLEQAVARDPSLGRAYGTNIAELYAEGGALDQAKRVLTEATTRYPGEFTWPYALAGLLLDAGKPADALEYALAAQSASYGDNRLRAVRLVARVLHQLGRSREALTVIDEALAQAPKPAEGLDVRTHRYLKQVAETRAEIEASLKP